ncbi:hypothetical protein ILYODFUR_033890 [Ilyodon furcidens]|uniref:Uncharacterized protein n=1 Tax=Ilyodon furcidens TaxID=33524 RepID=A0ABV0V8F4_9TELE
MVRIKAAAVFRSTGRTKYYAVNAMNDKTEVVKMEAKNRTKKRNKMRRKKSSETEQHKTNPPLLSPVLVPALAPVPSHSFQKCSAHHLLQAFS